ncbi:MAG: glycosyltransferase family 2 protein [Sedimentisphaerales bacterium]
MRNCELKNGYCEIVKKHVPVSWCDNVCKGNWDGKTINPAGMVVAPMPLNDERINLLRARGINISRQKLINPIIPVRQQAMMQNTLGLRTLASELFGAAKRAVKEGFAIVDEKVFAERIVCCSTCGGIDRCPYCECYLGVKNKLESEKGCPNPTTYPKLKKYPPRNFWEVVGAKTSAIIIGRNENAEWFNKTITSLFGTATGKLEIIVIVDGFADPIKPLASWGELKVITHPIPQGRRKGINDAVKRATGDYIFIIDAHCRMSEGWDTRLKCACDENTIAVARIKSMAEDFETELPGDYGFVYISPDCQEKWHTSKMPTGGDLIEPMMGFTGCAWMIRKTDFERLGGYDESLGEYGYDGPEWSFKIQLDTDGKVVLRKDVICWHIFGTNHEHKLYDAKILPVGEFKLRMVEKYHDRIGWLAAQFMPLPEWDTKAIVYGSGGPTIVCCTSGLGEKSVIETCIEHLKNMPIDKRVIFVPRDNNKQPCHRTYYEQLLMGVSDAEDARFIYIAEHDVLYHPSHFAFMPPRDDTFYFDLNVVWLTRRGYIKESPGELLSMMVAPRELLIEWLTHRIKHIDAGGEIDRCEPTIGDFTSDWSIIYPPRESARQARRPQPKFEPKGPKYYIEEYRAIQPSVDIRHKGNWTGDREGIYFESLKSWGDYRAVWKEMASQK